VSPGALPPPPSVAAAPPSEAGITEGPGVTGAGAACAAACVAACTAAWAAWAAAICPAGVIAMKGDEVGVPLGPTAKRLPGA
jgi:hypothetical protein